MDGSAVASGGGTGSSSMLLYIPAISSIVESISVFKRKVHHQTIFAPHIMVTLLNRTTEK